MTRRKDDKYDRLERRVAALEGATRGPVVSGQSTPGLATSVHHQDACRQLGDIIRRIQYGEKLPKIALIKIVRALTGTGLLEAKTLVENHVL